MNPNDEDKRRLISIDSLDILSISTRCPPSYICSQFIEKTAYRKVKKIVLVKDDNEDSFYKLVDNVLYSKDMKSLYYYASLKGEKHFDIPEGVEIISEYAFIESRYLETITIPETVKEIRRGAFLGSENLWFIQLPSSLKKLGSGAFCYCSSLEKVEFPEGMTELPSTEILSISTGTSLDDDEPGVFEHCKRLREVKLPDSMKIIGRRAFAWCYALNQINMPKSLEEIREFAFTTTRFKWQNIEALHLDFPCTLKTIATNALPQYCCVTAFEGTAKGLFKAIYSPYQEQDKSIFSLYFNQLSPEKIKEIKAIGSKVNIKKKDGTEWCVAICSNFSTEIIYKTILKHLNAAWNGDFFDEQNYICAFELFKDTGPKIQTAMSMLQRQDPPEVYIKFLKRHGKKLVDRYIQEHDEQSIISLVKHQIISKQRILSLLEELNAHQMTTAAAYVLEYSQKIETKKRSRLKL